MSVKQTLRAHGNFFVRAHLCVLSKNDLNIGNIFRWFIYTWKRRFNLKAFENDAKNSQSVFINDIWLLLYIKMLTRTEVHYGYMSRRWENEPGRCEARWGTRWFRNEIDHKIVYSCWITYARVLQITSKTFIFVLDLTAIRQWRLPSLFLSVNWACKGWWLTFFQNSKYSF